MLTISEAVKVVKGKLNSLVPPRLTLPPRNRLIIYGVIAATAISYLAWCRYGSKPPAPGQVVTAPTVSAVANEPTKLANVPRLVVFADGAKVADKIGTSRPSPREVIPQAVEVPKLKYGGKAVVYTNTSTGQSRTEIKSNPSPWFQPLHDNAIGVGYGIGTDGNTASIRYRRDLLQVKAVTFSAELEANYAEQRTRPLEGRAMGWAEIRW